MMQYVLQPSQDDVLHSAKGTTWKAHKYVDIVTKNGKKYYKYGRYLASRAKSKITGRDAVTNADAKKAKYSGKNYTQYNPSIATVNPYRDQGLVSFVGDGPRIYADENGYLHKTTNYTQKAVTKALLENMTATSKSRGLTLYGDVMQSHREISSIPVTNADGTPYSPTQNTRVVTNKDDTSYTPTYKTSPKPYSPTVKTFYNGNLPTEYTGTNVGKGNVISGKNHYQVLNRRKKKK